MRMMCMVHTVRMEIRLHVHIQEHRGLSIQIIMYAYPQWAYTVHSIASVHSIHTRVYNGRQHAQRLSPRGVRKCDVVVTTAARAPVTTPFVAHLALEREKDVRRLEVSVHDPLPVHMADGLANLTRKAESYQNEGKHGGVAASPPCTFAISTVARAQDHN